MKIFSEIPSSPPKTPVLDKVNLPEDIKNLTSIELKSLADDVRATCFTALVKAAVILVVVWEW
jgi:hypothetical protein